MPSDAGDDPRTWPVKHSTSYGGVVVRDAAGGPEVAMIRPRGTSSKTVWALPKGAKDGAEDAAAAAVREVREETGLEAEIVERFDPITYFYVWAPERVRYRKSVHFFLMRHVSGEPVPDEVEVAEVRFFPLAEAPKKASYASERKILERARSRLLG